MRLSVFSLSFRCGEVASCSLWLDLLIMVNCVRFPLHEGKLFLCLQKTTQSASILSGFVDGLCYLECRQCGSDAHLFAKGVYGIFL